MPEFKSIDVLVAPSSILPDDVELLRHLIVNPTTSEQELEEWVREHPQVVGSSPKNLYPHHRVRLPVEAERYWDPDILYKESETGPYDIIELKKADLPLIVGGSQYIRLIPSKPPRFSSELTKAISQLQVYLYYAEQYREYFETAHQLEFFVPRGTLIAGKECTDTDDRLLRFLAQKLPNNIHLVTWSAILRKAEQLKAYRTSINVLYLPEPNAESGDSFVGKLAGPGLILLAHVAGRTRGNPGPAGIGVVVSGAAGPVRIAKWIGNQDSNVAEYAALMEALQYAVSQRAQELRVYSHSEVVVKQMSGEEVCRSPRLYSLHWTCRMISRSLKFSVEYIPKTQNIEASSLAQR